MKSKVTARHTNTYIAHKKWKEGGGGGKRSYLTVSDETQNRPSSDTRPSASLLNWNIPMPNFRPPLIMFSHLIHWTANGLVFLNTYFFAASPTNVLDIWRSETAHTKWHFYVRLYDIFKMTVYVKDIVKDPFQGLALKCVSVWELATIFQNIWWKTT